MRRLFLVACALPALVLLVSGCMRDCPAVTGSTSPVAPSSSPTDPSVTASQSPPGSLSSPQSSAAAVGSVAPTTSLPPDVPKGTKSLPEVRLRSVGLHIGGGANDEADRQLFKRAIEAHFESFLECYKSVAEPDKGGTFGVDLFIGRAGGTGEVRQPRTGMKGTEFRDCMVAAFSKVVFEKPKAGPTVISYSLKFELIDG